MPKYTISIADIDINVCTEEKPEMVDTLVGIIDRRIRDIIAKSPRSSKSEAAILCALDYCAERIKSENKTREMEHEFIKASRELEKMTAAYSELEAEAENLRRENRTMNEIIAKAAANVSEPEQIEEEDIDETPAEETVSIEKEPQMVETLPSGQLTLGAFPEPTPAKEPAPRAEGDVMFTKQNADELIVRRQVQRRQPNKSDRFGGDIFGTLTFKDI